MIEQKVEMRVNSNQRRASLLAVLFRNLRFKEAVIPVKTITNYRELRQKSGVPKLVHRCQINMPKR
jgi:hypothetical protein